MKMRASAVLIAVVGGSQCSPADYQAAAEVGRLIACRGGIVICGGLSGVMEAACRGAVEAGGMTVGVLPGEEPDQANQFVTIPIVTGIGIARNIIIVRSAGALIAVDGKYGTLSEIAFALQLGKPVFCLNSWNTLPGVTPVDSPTEAVEKAFQALK